MIACKLNPAHLFLILSLSVMIFCSSCGQINELTLVNNGLSDYEIVIPDGCCEAVKQAAEDLQLQVQKISNCTIPITTENKTTEVKKKIFIGKEGIADSANQVVIKNDGKNLIVTGGNAEATSYAVTIFLEEYLGYRWYSPDVEKIPQQNTVKIALPLNYNYTPEITTRTVHSRLFYENAAFANRQKVTIEAFPGYVPVARVHTFNRLVPEKKYYKSHPEYYALRGDRRLPTQLCLTNSEVLQIVKDSVKAYFTKYPNARVCSVSQDDNTQHCQCENCIKIDTEEGSASGTMIRFVNQVANEFPDKMICTLAYQYTRKPCKTKPASNVLITLCSIECDRSAPIEQKCTDFAADLMGWKLLTENIRIWDYTTQFTNFLAPFPNLKTLKPNIQFFRNNHAKWIFEQHSHNPSELFELRSYLTAKLLWNPDANVEEIIADFTNGYYKEAGVYVKKYIDRVHEELQKTPNFFLYLYGDPSQAFVSFLKPELLVEYNQYFDQAEKAVATKPTVLQRVKTARLGVDYASLEAARKNSFVQYKMINNEGGKKHIDPETLEKLNNFKQTCQQNGITLMNEMGYTVDEYCSSYEKTIERLLINNVAKGKKVTLQTKAKKYAAEDPQTLTDGALGGSSFYANWLGFEGNNMEAVIDLETIQTVDSIASTFLQVTNHIVFFPEKVSFWYSVDKIKFKPLGEVINIYPLQKKSKVNDIQDYNLYFKPVQARYIKIIAQNMNIAPQWHNAAGLPVWVFCDEVMVN